MESIYPVLLKHTTPDRRVSAFVNTNTYPMANTPEAILDHMKRGVVLAPSRKQNFDKLDSQTANVLLDRMATTCLQEVQENDEITPTKMQAIFPEKEFDFLHLRKNDYDAGKSLVFNRHWAMLISGSASQEKYKRVHAEQRLEEKERAEKKKEKEKKKARAEQVVNDKQVQCFGCEAFYSAGDVIAWKKCKYSGKVKGNKGCPRHAMCLKPECLDNLSTHESKCIFKPT